MIKLNEYFTGDPMQEDFERLCNPELDFETDREKVNVLALNLIIKYLAAYLEVAHTDISAIRSKVNRIIDKKNLPELYDPLILEQYGPYLEGAESDYFPVKCLADVRRTAAIFKEIAFNDRFKANGHFVGMDFGSGTGILTLAMAISAKRRQIEELLCIGVELRELAANNSRRVLREMLEEDEISIIHKHILISRILPKLLKKYIPQFWVSETISKTTPPIDLEQRDFGFTTKEIMYRDKYEACDDPFPEFLGQTMNALPGFLDDVRGGKIAMFPNIANRSYYPHREQSALNLRTGLKQPLRLKNIGREFKDYEDLGEDRRRG